MSKVDVLMMGPLMPPAARSLDQNFIVHRYWEAADKKGLLADVAGRIRGISGGGQALVDKALIDALPKLEAIANFGVGYDTVDAAYAATKNIMVTNTPDVLNEEVADLALGLLLATVRQLPQADRYLREGKWLKGPFPLTATLRERTIGILGLGRIGKAIAKRCAAFGLAIAYHGRSRQADVDYAYHDTLVGLAKAVDVLVVIAPGGPETKNMVNAEVLKALGPDGILINVARGTVVDEAALIEALKSKTILSAGLDVFAFEPKVPAELIAMDHVVLLPHVGSGSIHTRNGMAQLVVDNLIAWFAGKGPLTPVKETPWPRQG
jgi:lactate dehydrogenase-like 2-hydroxyacid dehydrogenase